jgi:hypothetical protein
MVPRLQASVAEQHGKVQPEVRREALGIPAVLVFADRQEREAVAAKRRLQGVEDYAAAA